MSFDDNVGRLWSREEEDEEEEQEEEEDNEENYKYN